MNFTDKVHKVCSKMEKAILKTGVNVCGLRVWHCILSSIAKLLSALKTV